MSRPKKNNKKRMHSSRRVTPTPDRQRKAGTPTATPKSANLASQALIESKRATFWQKMSFVLGALVLVGTGVGVYYAIQANSSSQPNLMAKASLGWILKSRGIFVAREVSQMRRPNGATDAIVFDVTDTGGAGTRVESLTIKFKCRSNGRCLSDTFFQTGQGGQPGELTLPTYIQPNDSVTMPVPLACGHNVLAPVTSSESVVVHALVTVTGGKTVSAGSLTVPSIPDKAVQACIRSRGGA